MEPYTHVFDLEGRPQRRKAPVNLFTETDIYTIPLADGGRDLRLEHGFAGLEDKFTRIRNTRLARGHWPTAEEMAHLLIFTAVAKIRTQSMRNFQRKQWGRIRERMEEFAADFRSAAPERQAAIRAMPNLSSVNSGGTIALEQVIQMQEQPIQTMIAPNLESVLPILSRMCVAIFRTNDKTGFVTTDTPCTWFNPDNYKKQPMYRGVGLEQRKIEITMPISPSMCLFISYDPERQGFIDVATECVDELNRRHIAHADQHFISNSAITKPIWFERGEMPDDAWEKERERRMADEAAAFQAEVHPIEEQED